MTDILKRLNFMFIRFAAETNDDASIRRVQTAKDAAEEIKTLREALKGLLQYATLNECFHENTHRGGIIWTICDDCGKKWADDEGGFKPYCEPVAITAARQALGENP